VTLSKPDITHRTLRASRKFNLKQGEKKEEKLWKSGGGRGGGAYKKEPGEIGLNGIFQELECVS